MLSAQDGFLGAVLLLICGPIIVFCNFSISLVWIAKLSFTLFVFFWDGLPSSAPITQAELGSSILAKFSYVVPDLSRVACQVFQLYCLYALDLLRYVALGCQMYCQSTFLPV